MKIGVGLHEGRRKKRMVKGSKLSTGKKRRGLGEPAFVTV